MICEGNRYFDKFTTGIGFHGDTERRRVVGVRIGETMKMKWAWFHENKNIGESLEIELSHGDIYIMSEKAVGTDWKSPSKYTIRHAAGSKKYLRFKEQHIKNLS